MNIPRRSLFGKLNTSLFKAMESATAYARLKNHPYVELSHWLWHFWQLTGTDIHHLAAHHQVDLGAVEAELRQASALQPTDAQGLIDFGPQVLAAIEKAWMQASLYFGDHQVRSAWLLAALLNDAQLRLALRSIAPSLLKIQLPIQADAWASLLKGSREQNEHAQDAGDLPASVPGEASGALGAPQDNAGAIQRYCTDLTEQARLGQLDPVIGRENEIRTMTDILLRRRQNNPLLTGEAGVGKTAVVEGLALAIAAAEVPPAMQSVRVLTLDVGALLAGASMRGEFEARLKQLLREIQDCDTPVILFIDEIHTLVGAGGQAGTGDAANLLKPALARGGLRTIGATTWSEFKKHIEKDPALTRRFQVLQVHEPEVAAAMGMVRSLVETFARHHGVVIDNAAAEAAVELSHRYIPARQLPDKAISLLDTACARVAMSQHAEPAALVACKASIRQLESRLALCRQDEQRQAGKGSDIAAMQAELQQLQADQARIEQGWQQQKECVRRLQAQWQALQNSADESASDLIAAKQQSQQASLQLSQMHEQQQAMVHAQVDASVIADVVSDWTGIPVGKMLSDDMQMLLGLERVLSARVKGQSHALQAIAQRVQIAKSGLTDPAKPIAVFMLVGPSGVGKTETALALAEAVYGGEQNLITLNMSEFQESHTVSTIKGSPPGYVGYGEGGVLTEAVRRRPYSVILLDEIEKAHPDVHEVFYQVFDKGWMEDGEGRQIDFRNTLILLTSNTGSELVAQLCEDQDLMPEVQGLADALDPELRKVFPAAFLGRMSVIPYFPLSSGVIAQIVDLQWQKVVQRMFSQHQIHLHSSPAAQAQMGQAAGSLEIGGRRIAQHIERQILPILARYWLESMQRPARANELLLDWQAETGYVLTEGVHGPDSAGAGI